jgi:hypothetical protein
MFSLRLIEKQKRRNQMFSAIQVTPSLFPSLRSENRKTSLQGLIFQNNLDFPNKRIVYCQDFYKEPGIAD